MLSTVRLTALLAALALTLTACGSDTGERNDSRGHGDDGIATSAGATDLTDLAGRTLVVTEIVLDGEPHAIVDGTQVRFNFAEKRVSVETGCNTLNGSWDRADDTLTFGQMMATMIGCEAAVAAQEELLAKALEEPIVVERDTFVAGDLTLHLVDRETISPDLDLAGQRWHLEALVDDQAVSSVPRGVEAWLELEGAELRLNAGCNSGSGTATIDGDNLDIHDLAMTEMACDGDRGDVEKQVLAVLTGQVHAQVREQTLTLTGANGRALVWSARER